MNDAEYNGPNTYEILAIKEAVRERDGRRCTRCGMTEDANLRQFGGRLQVHRLDAGSVYTLHGCVSLCLPCHRKIPRAPKDKPKPGDPRPRSMFDCPDWVRRVAKFGAAMEGITVSQAIVRAILTTYPKEADIIREQMGREEPARKPKKKPD